MTFRTICVFFVKNKYLFVLILLLILLLGIQNFLYPPLPGHDFRYHYNRLYTLYESMIDGTFPNYMDYYLINGYGYLVKNFYSNFLLIPFAELSRLISVKHSYNLLLLSSTLFCGLASYFSFKGVTKNKFGAIIFTLLYSTSAYRFICLYERGALGEALAISCIPLVFWGIYEVINGDYKKFYILSIGLSLMIYSHAITSLLSVLACFIYFSLGLKQIISSPIRIKYLIYAVFLCVLLSLYHILPYFEMLNFDHYQFSKNNNQIRTQEIGSIIYGALKLYDNIDEPYNPKIGLLIAVPAILLRFFVNRKNRIIRSTDVFLIGGILLLFACSDYFPWNMFPFRHLAIIQYSYRLFSIASFLFTFCSAVYCSILLRKYYKKLTVFFIFLGLILVFLFLESSRYKNQTKSSNPEEIDVTTKQDGIIGAEFLPASFHFPTNRKALTIDNNNPDTRIENISKNKGCLIFDLYLNSPDTLILPLTYYKGYKVTINNHDIDYFSTDGLMTINPSTSGKIKTQYIGTSIIKASLIVSTVSYFIVILFLLINYKRGEKNHS